MSEIGKTGNSQVYKRLKKSRDCSCSFCKPNRGENASRKAKHGSKKPKYKDKK